eukprot:2546904-Pyramimonas_sp.AAC.1
MPVAPGRDQQLRPVFDDRPDALWNATAARAKSPRGLRVVRTPPDDVWRSPTNHAPRTPREFHVGWERFSLRRRPKRP